VTERTIVDHHRFDTLTRALASGASRRVLLVRLTPGVLMALPLLGNDDAAAKPCPPCRKKKRGKCRKKRPDGTPWGRWPVPERALRSQCLHLGLPR
jgi:hypothetical protein